MFARLGRAWYRYRRAVALKLREEVPPGPDVHLPAPRHARIDA